MYLPANVGVGTNVPAPPHQSGGVDLNAGLAVLLAVTAVNFLLLSIWGVRRIFLDKPTFRRDWSFVDLWTGLHVIGALLLAGAAPLMMSAANGHSNAAQALSDPNLILPLLFVQNAAFFMVPAGFIRWKYGLALRQIGMTPVPTWRNALTGVGLGLAAVVVSKAIEMPLAAIAQHYSYLPFVQWGLSLDANQPIKPIIDAVTKQGPLVLALAVVAIGPGPAFGEEMLFRGFLYNIVKNRLGVWPGILISALVFAAVHGYFIGFPIVLLLGIALAYTYKRTGSLWTGIFFHATNNGVLVLLAYFVPSFAR